MSYRFELSLIKEEIKQKLRKLADREKELKRCIRKSKASILHFKELLHQLDDRTISESRLREISQELNLKVRVKWPFRKLAKYFMKKELRRLLELEKRRLNQALHDIEFIPLERERANICPKCSGKGSFRKTIYIRENGIITPHLKFEHCTLCGGSGRINI